MASQEPMWNENTRSIAGARMRRTRLQQNLSIRQLADLAKMSKTSVVQAESGRTSRRSTYLKIAEVLGLHLDRLLQESTVDEKTYAVHHHHDDAWYDLANFSKGRLSSDAHASGEVRAELHRILKVSPLNILASRLEHGRIKPTIIEVFSESPKRWHTGEEHVYVLEGSAVIHVGSDAIELAEGESITFWSAEPHSYGPAEGTKLPVRLLSVRVDS